MLDNVLFSLNSTFPLFLVMAVGFFIRKIKIVDGGFVKTANNFNFKVTIPALLFADMAAADFRKTFDLKFLVFCMGATIITILGLWGVSKLVMRKDKASVAEFVQGCYRASLAVSGIALIQSVSGNTSMAGMMMLCSVPFYNIFAVIILQTESPDKSIAGEKGRVGKALLGIAKNPIIISILAGFVSSMIGIDYPQIIDSTLSLISRIGTPFALMCIGADFDFRKAFGKIGKSGLAAAFKLVIIPAIFLPAAILLGFRNEQLVSILIMFASPSTPVGYVMAKQYGHDGTITSSTIAITTLFSSLTLAAFIFVLRSLGYI